MISGNTVNSRRCTSGGMYGRKFARNGLSGLKLTLSGYSIARAASSGVMLSLDINVTSD